MTQAQLPAYVTTDYLKALRFRSGKGTGKEGDRCSIQEYRAWRGLDPASDEVPKTDSHIVGHYIIGFQDRLINAGATPEQVYELVGRHLPKLHMSGRGKDLEKRRSFLLLDMLARELAPMWFELTPELADYAKQLRALPVITDSKSNEKAYKIYDAARTAAWNARRTHIANLEAKVRDAIAQAKPEGLSDRDLKIAAAAVVVAADAAVVAAAVVVAADADADADAAAADAAAAADDAAVADADADADADAAAAADAVAAAAAAVVAAAADADAAAAAAADAAVARRPGESDDEYYWRLRGEFYGVARKAIYDTMKDALLAKHRETILKSWDLGSRFIEQALEMREAA